MRRVRWATAGLLLPLYAWLLITVGQYASRLEATYQPGVPGATSAPVSYSQQRIARLLPALPAGDPAPAAESAIAAAVVQPQPRAELAAHRRASSRTTRKPETM